MPNHPSTGTYTASAAEDNPDNDAADISIIAGLGTIVVVVLLLLGVGRTRLTGASCTTRARASLRSCASCVYVHDP